MICQWDAYLSILPVWLRQDVDVLGKQHLQETRLRIGYPPQLVLKNRSIKLRRTVRQEDLDFVIHTASKYSPWSAHTTAYGFLTAPGGHRIGMCGETVVQNGKMTGIRTMTSVCIRVARQFPNLMAGFSSSIGSVLIIGPPGSGKTTLLREWIRRRSNEQQGNVGVVDERGELFPSIQGTYCMDIGENTDVITGCSKAVGIECLLRTMTPSCIAVDEVTSEEDCMALVQAMWSGVDLLATAHASEMDDLYRRPVYQKLMQCKMFSTVVIMDRQQQWHTERMAQCI